MNDELSIAESFDKTRARIRAAVERLTREGIEVRPLGSFGPVTDQTQEVERAAG